jgi:hypothetical protein
VVVAVLELITAVVVVAVLVVTENLHLKTLLSVLHLQSP